MIAHTQKRIQIKLLHWMRSLQKSVYQRMYPANAQTIPVFVVGCQRSGTNMFLKVIDKPNSTWTYNEGTNAAFLNYRTRSLETLDALIHKTRARHIVFKPLCDSQWTGYDCSLSQARRPRQYGYTEVTGMLPCLQSGYGEVTRKRRWVVLQPATLRVPVGKANASSQNKRRLWSRQCIPRE